MTRHAGVAATPGVVHRVLALDGGPVSVYSAGPADRPAVVLLHGAMFDEARFSWDQLFPALAERFRVIAVDLPGHGGSRPWGGHLGHERLLTVLEAAFEQLGLDRFALVGLSMGGGLALGYASRHPERVTRMVLVEPGGLGERLDHQFLTWLWLRLPGTRSAVSRAYAGASEARLRRLLEKLYVGGSRPTDPDRLVGILRDEIAGKRRCRESDLDDWQTDAIGPRRLTCNLLDRIPRVACPTLWLRGAESTLVSAEEMERAVDLAAAPATLTVIPGAGHMLPLERPADVKAAVLAFLDGGVDESATAR